ncbi:spindle pole body component 97 [Cavenderia fasciculata]|uniref:Spindle pole body component n=1 Tax=Cavenderia fasciculata TaxID=261658 RepID=F4PY98_CACFS|nr:spindle pole body component 97 [Cavenderia fasciculata]EGG19365.1 spindle pole body component 97 [Cavenderia fasciculata]|eukprot:XP_004357636.1 spindle pole body component 97 [Cavenderia fasciculata]
MSYSYNNTSGGGGGGGGGSHVSSESIASHHTYQLNLSPRTLKKLGEISSSQQQQQTAENTIFPPRHYHRKQLRGAAAKKRSLTVTTQAGTTIEIPPPPIAKLPEWTRKRSFLNNGFLNDSLSLTYEPNHQPVNRQYNTHSCAYDTFGKYQTSIQSNNVPAFDSLSPSHQEYCLMEDLLFVMLGIEGKMIHLEKTYSLTEDIDQDQESYHHQQDGGLSKVVSTMSTTITMTKKTILESNPPKSPLVEFIIDASVDESLMHLVRRILPVCSYYIYIADFIDTRLNFEWGVICHSLCESIQSLIKDYHQLVTNLENQLKSNTLSLQRMWYYIQPTLRIFESVYNLLYETIKSNLYGSQILNLLFNSIAIYGCDQTSKELYLYFIEYCSKPFLKMLEDWIYRGTVNDVHGEFMIEENLDLQKENINKNYNDSYWENRYIVRRDQAPKFLEKVVQKILLTGKYLNVIKECTQGNIKYENASPLIYSQNEKDYIERIDKAYDFASSTLLKQMNDMNLLNRLKSLKHYFLLCQGDFISHFMEITDEELKKPLTEISTARMNSLLQLSLRTSATLQEDINKDDLEIEFLPHRLSDQLLSIINIGDQSHQQRKMNGGTIDSLSSTTTTTTTSNNTTGGSIGGKPLLGIESLAFNYKVKWPLSLVISRKSLVKYQIIFRHLFLCKHVEKLLCNTWNLHQESRRKFSHKPGLTSLLSFSHFFRHRLIHFLQNLEYYMMLEVLEPNWNRMKEAIKNSTTVDEVIKVHDSFLETCLTECMLTDTRLVSLLMKFLNLCTLVSDLITKLVSEDTVLVVEEVGVTIRHFEQKFHHILRLLLDTLKSFSTSESNRHMIHLITRLDYNNYYSNYFEQNPIVVAKQQPTQPTQQPQPSSSSSSSTTRPQTSQLTQQQLQQYQQQLQIQQQQQLARRASGASSSSSSTLPTSTTGLATIGKNVNTTTDKNGGTSLNPSPELTSTTTTTTITTTTTTRSPSKSRANTSSFVPKKLESFSSTPAAAAAAAGSSTPSTSLATTPSTLSTITAAPINPNVTGSPTTYELEQKLQSIKNRAKLSSQ